jgi:predicted nucleic acid-binding protein
VVERYEVDIPEDDTDRKFIKAALAAARHEDVVYLVTYDSGLLEVDLGKLKERYQEAEKIKIVEPKEAIERLKSASSR